MDFVAFGQEELGKVRAVLPGDSGDQCALWHERPFTINRRRAHPARKGTQLFSSMSDKGACEANETRTERLTRSTRQAEQIDSEPMNVEESPPLRRGYSGSFCDTDDWEGGAFDVSTC